MSLILLPTWILYHIISLFFKRNFYTLDEWVNFYTNKNLIISLILWVIIFLIFF